MSLSFQSRACAAVLAAGALLLASCVTEDGAVTGFGPKHLQPLSPQTLALIEQKGMAKDSPILLRIFKEESELEIWKQAKDGKFALLKTYPICRWSGELGPKIKEGDRQAPEGFYFITPELMNPRSSYYLAFNLGYPNEFDRAHGRTGSHLMVHGDCSSRGCYAMTDEQIAEIFALARESFDGGQLAFQVQAFPFRMTAKNMARHRNNPHLAFWRMIKEGHDHFELTKKQPKIDVCSKRYVFNAHLKDPSQLFDPTGPCPEYSVPEEIATAYAAKKAADDREFKFLASIGIPTAPVVTGRDGATNHALASRATLPPTARALASSAEPARPAATEVTGSAVAATVPLPPSNPQRRRLVTSASVSAAKRAITANGRANGRAAPAQKTEGSESQKAGSAKSESSGGDNQTPAGRGRAAPAIIPGATPIITSGGFSYR